MEETRFLFQDYGCFSCDLSTGLSSYKDLSSFIMHSMQLLCENIDCDKEPLLEQICALAGFLQKNNLCNKILYVTSNGMICSDISDLSKDDIFEICRNMPTNNNIYANGKYYDILTGEEVSNYNGSYFVGDFIKYNNDVYLIKDVITLGKKDFFSLTMYVNGRDTLVSRLISFEDIEKERPELLSREVYI